MTRYEPLTPSELDSQIAAVAVLNEPVRRALYRFAVGRAGAVSRDQAAQEVGISRELAAFHLDKLVEHGLLEVEYRRLSGRTGPGAGRPAKLYRRSERQLDITVPDRRYELAARLFAQALEQTPVAVEALDRAARQFGHGLGAGVRRHSGLRPSRERLLERMCGILADYGFQPVRTNGEVRLRNCPFDALARDHTGLACGMNLSFLQGVVAGLRARDIEARLQPDPDMCCVVVSVAPSEAPATPAGDRAAG